ncbi:DDE-type integrase/transposase/recombinase [Rhodococcus sp. HM1]|nr:DDE-type integrase/transposase/recombinase [Rhodococcus sp. HM1]
MDGTQVTLADGSKAWIVDILDDHARYAIGATAARRFTAHAARRAMETAIDEHGAPRQLIGDNGRQFKSGKGHKPVYFQERLAALGIAQLSSRPRHPQTCGKLEHYHRTFNRSTVHRATDIPFRFRLACTLRTPYTPRLSA